MQDLAQRTDDKIGPIQFQVGTLGVIELTKKRIGEDLYI